MADDDVPSDSSLLVVIVDTNPNQRYIIEDPKMLTNVLDAVVAFSNSHLMQKASNELAVIGCHFHKSEYLYPSPGKPLDVRQIDGQYELFTLVEKTIKMRLVNLIKSQPQEEKPGESLLAGALALGLCFIARSRRSAIPGLRTSSRILVVTGSADTAAQYINYMNVFFTAQWVFLPEANERSKLVLPGRGRVDYRAACFCHRELLTIGYVCSVCLSVFCKFSPICTTCHTVFKIGGPPIKPKKKKMKV
ncbi:general transcription factor IIH subunit 3 isoform X4 [Bombyx mori]|uniref:general transcription factor IIH subunit 3 isoform X4 n=1 Tax=Bombyx mori TaxID=7091 RepID=UPI002ED46781